MVFSYTIIQYDINAIIAAGSLTWRGRLLSPIGRLPVFVRLEKFHFSPRTTQTLLATFVRSSQESSDFLSGLSVSVPERVGLPSPSMPPHAVREKSVTFCNFIRRGLPLLSSPSGPRLSRPQPADNSNGHHAPQAQARGLLPLCEHLWLPFTELRPHYIYDSQDLI